MNSRREKTRLTSRTPGVAGYDSILADVAELLESARRTSARAVLTAAYWEVGRRIVEFEQGGAERAGYGGLA